MKKRIPTSNQPTAPAVAMASEPPPMNALLRDLHLARRGVVAPEPPAQTASSAIVAPPSALSALPQRPAIHIRSAAQRAAAQRFAQPRAVAHSSQSSSSSSPAPLIGCEAFYKHKQANIKHSRAVYDRQVEAHYDSLKQPAGHRAAPLSLPPSSDPIALVAHERASRHVAPITEFVHGASSTRATGINSNNTNALARRR